MNMRGMLLVWIGLMGLAGTTAVWLLLATFPRAFADSGPAIVLPWRRAAAGSARVRGGLLLAAAIMSAGVALAGVASLFS